MHKYSARAIALGRNEALVPGWAMKRPAPRIFPKSPGLRLLCMLLFSVFWTPPSLVAQSTELSGRIADPRGGIVAGAAIRLTRIDTQLTLETSSNDSGYYFFSNVQPGEYAISISQPGFKTLEQSGITVAIADKKRLDLRLELGSVQETLTVTSNASQLQMNSAEVSTTITARDFERLPQIQFNRMRSPANFLYLSPSVHGNIGTNGRETVSASNNIRINGSRSTSNEMYLDGLPGRTNFNETAPPVDAVGEFKLQENQLSAEYGNTGSAVITFSSKSGTNDFHGQVFDILRNEKLDARSFIAPARSTIRQNEFGATIGGPVWLPKLYNGKNKTFFYFAYTGSRKRGLDQTQRIRVPTSAERRGDFSQNPRMIYDPATTRTEGTRSIRDAFAGNVIPESRFDPVAARITALLPQPNLTGAGVLNYQGNIGERLLDPDVYLTRIDHSFAQAHRVFGTYNHTRIPRQNQTVTMADPFSDLTLQNVSSHMIRGTYDWIVSSNLLNTLLVGFNRFRNPFQGFYANQGYAEQFGLQNIVGGAFPTFGFGDSYGDLGRSSLSDSTDSSFIVKDIVSHTRGRQSFKFGVEFRDERSRSLDQSTSAGDYTFSNLATALPTSSATTGDSYASFLLGQINTASISLPFESAYRKPYWGFFAQDDFRLSSRLTLNLGLRYEFTQAPYELNDQYSLVDLTVPNPAAGNRPGASVFAGTGEGRIGSRQLNSTDYSSVGPRAGFAWQPFSRTVIRGGYGLFYGDNDISPVTNGYRVTPNFQSLDQGLTSPFVLSQGFPGTLNPSPQLGPSLLNRQSVTARSSSASRMPLTQNWSFSLQRELSPNWVIEFSYVANRASRLSSSNMINDNQVDPKYLSLGSLLTQPANSPAAIAQGITLPYPAFTGSVAQALRPFPQYLTITEQSAKAGASFFQNAVARIRKRYSSGFTIDAHYTFSKLLATSDTVQNNFNRRAEWTLDDYDIPHALVMQYTYELPFGPGKAWLTGNGPLSYFVAGWSVNGIHRYQSGTPLFVTVNNNLPIFSRTLRPDAVAGTRRYVDTAVGDFQPGSDRRINASAFRSPAPFTFGNAAPSYGDLRNFPVLTEDFSVIKNTAIGERATVEFVAQFINALNRHRFTSFETNLNSPTFGQATGASLGRIVTLGLKVKF